MEDVRTIISSCEKITGRRPTKLLLLEYHIIGNTV